MDEHKKALEDVIARYLQGNNSPEEKQNVEQWLETLDLSDGQPLPNDTHRIEMKRRIDIRTGATEMAPRIRRKQPLWIAAAAVLIFTAALVYQKSKISSVPTISAIPETSSATPLYTLTNTSLKDTLFMLSDGSKVRLTPKSSLTWKTGFETDKRQLRLEGKAFFQVAKDAKRPFAVYAGDIITTAIGTSFWIDKSEGCLSAKVRLVTGKVSIRKKQKDGIETLLTTLSPGQQWSHVVHEKSLATKSKRNSPLRLKQKIAQENLAFHHTPLSEVLPLIADYYTIKINFETNELKGMSFYGTYNRNNDVRDILQTIAIANDLTLHYNEQENMYTLIKITE